MTIDNLLALLSDGAFHSGRELGEQLGISRSAVWKQIQRLETLGIEVYSVKGRGYRIPAGLDLLDQARVTEMLPPALVARLDRLEFANEVESTNTLALEALRSGARNGLFAAEFQTRGRGRRGREWVSPYAANLCFSLAWRFSAGLAALEGLSLGVGLALREGLRRIGIEEVQLKWPNDLLSRGRKLGGILVEISGDAAGECEVVIGVGLNVAMPANQLEQISQPCIDVSRLLSNRPGRNQLLATLVESLFETLDTFETQGFAVMREQWQQANAHRDAAVRLISGNNEVSGICRGVDERGALLLESEGQVQAYYGGEISVRAQQG
ncbi:bifunctional biotin--[acetyl-CoA-carboxylase] ligase/biotin operon repressor BirA [Marinobacterium sp. D7]|uniref:bifunctional biotin--[acetyl-CoA-carboxylase] ligase/biotin operon repressor BirA n=1 Tax=Marinobacterium ramblicola TaxID=2849041 RepID=UPI001C2CD9FF|nr:bifunctional biotin--[acetyl-CoA-carboxylase] ligase/biotin operon repressor BirA [Marinobacterium ramblicola]MBV1787910.1 bifunctional biotin--[acetyl-CoA-carboxylase] ligase/biotin operon repressor BirA [Marinobacterium ramblicola]